MVHIFISVSCQQGILEEVAVTQDDDWLGKDDNNGDKIRQWCVKREELVNDDDPRVKCNWCNTSFSLKSGLTNFLSYSNCQTHKRKLKDLKSNKTLTRYFSQSDKSNATKVSETESKRITTAEIKWVVRVVEKNYSFNIQTGLKETFKGMFTDSKTSSLGLTRYLTRFNTRSFRF